MAALKVSSAITCLRLGADNTKAAPAIAIVPGDFDAFGPRRAEPLVEFVAADIERSGRGQMIEDYIVNFAEREARNIAQIVGIKEMAREFRSAKRRVDGFEQRIENRCRHVREIIEHRSRQL